MHGRLVAVGGGDAVGTSPHPGGGVSPSGTPRHIPHTVGAYYFLLLHNRGMAVRRSAVVNATPSSHEGDSIHTFDNDNAGFVVYVVAIDNITGRFFFSGIPNVDMFPDEATAMLSLPKKVSLAPDGVRIQTVCHFEAWCGAYASDEHLHLLFVGESSAVADATTASCAAQPRPTTVVGAASSLPRGSPAKRNKGIDVFQEGVAETGVATSVSNIRRVDRMFWRSLRLQMPQNVLSAAPATPSGGGGGKSASAQHAHQQPPPSGESGRSFSTYSSDPERSVDFPVSTPSAAQVRSDYSGMLANSGTLKETGRSFYFSAVFDATLSTTTEAFLRESFSRETPSMYKPSSMWSAPASAVLRPEVYLQSTEHFWNAELVRFAADFGLGDLCVRLMYGSVQVMSSSEDRVAWHETALMVLFSRVSRAALRSTLVVDTSAMDALDLCAVESAEKNSNLACQQEAHTPMETELQLVVVLQGPPECAETSSMHRSNNFRSQLHSCLAYRGLHSLGFQSAQPGGATKNNTALPTNAGSLANPSEGYGLSLLRRARERRLSACVHDTIVPPRTTTSSLPAGPCGSQRHSSHSAQTLLSPITATSLPSGGKLSPGCNETRWHYYAQRLREELDDQRCSADGGRGPFQRDGRSATSTSRRQLSGGCVKRCCIADERQLAPALVMLFLWFLQDMQRHHTALAESIAMDLQQRSVTPKEGSVLRCLWKLLFCEAASQFSFPAHCDMESFGAVMETIRVLLSPAAEEAGTFCLQCRGRREPGASAAFTHDVWRAAACVQLNEQGGVALDHRHSAFLQGLVEHPFRYSRQRQHGGDGAAGVTYLLSDPNGGACIVRASTTAVPDTGNTPHQRTEIQLGTSYESTGTEKKQGLLSRSSGAGSAIPIPSLAALRSVLMPKSPGVYFPEGCESVSFTVALPTLSRITHIGMLVPTTNQEAMFAAPLCVSVALSDYLCSSTESVLFQDAPLPLCVGNTSTPALASMVLFAVPPSGGAVNTVGRFLEVTVRASGKIPLLLGNMFLFGQELRMLPIQMRGKYISTNSSAAQGQVSSAPVYNAASSITSWRTTSPGLESAVALSSVNSNAAQCKSVVLRPEEELRRLLSEEFVSLRMVELAAASRPRARSAALCSGAFTLQTGDRFRINESQSTVLLRGRMIEPSNFRGRSASPPETGRRSASPAPKSPAHWDSNADFTFVTTVPSLRRADSPVLPTERSVSGRSGGSGGQSPTTSSPTRSRANSIPRGDIEAEEQYFHCLRRFLSSPLSLEEAAQTEALRIRLNITKASRDRCCIRLGLPAWLLDLPSHVYHRGPVWESLKSKRQKESKCQRCESRLTFLSKKKECGRCGDMLCVKCAVERPVRLLELGLRDSVASVCSACNAAAIRIEAAVADVAKSYASTAGLVVQDSASLTLRASGILHRGGSPSPPRTHAFSQHNLLSRDVTVVPPVYATVAERRELFGCYVGARSADVYNLCVGNSAAVVSVEPFRSPQITSGVSPRATSATAVESILGDAVLPGRGWRCVPAEELGTDPHKYPSQRAVTILLPATAVVQELRLECVRHGHSGSLCPHEQDGAPPLDAACAATSGAMKPCKKRSGVSVALFLSDSYGAFTVPTCTSTAAEFQCCDRQRNVWHRTMPCAVAAAATDGTAYPNTSRLACLRFCGLRQDLHDLEWLHISLWGRYVMVPGDGATPSRLTFHTIGHATQNPCQQVYVDPRAAPEQHQRHSFIVGGSSGPGSGLAPALQGGSFHNHSYAAHLPRTLHKVRHLTTAKMSQPLVPLSSSTSAPAPLVVEFDLGAAVTVCGVTVEGFHPALCPVHRIATLLRFTGVGVNGKRGNIGIVYLPTPAVPMLQDDLHNGFVACDALSMSFAFPTSNHDVRAVQVEVADWKPLHGEIGSPVLPHGSAATLAFPFFGKLSFWTASDSHTRRIVASGAFVSDFSSKPL